MLRFLNIRKGIALVVVVMMMVSAIPLLSTSAEAAVPVPSWQQNTTMPVNASQAAVVADGEGTIYVMGGHGETSLAATNASWSFNTQTGQWTRLADMWTGVRGAAVATAPDGRVVVFGGADRTGAIVKTIQVYDPASDNWTKSSQSLMDGVWEGKAVYLESLQRFYIIGGATSFHGTNTVQWVGLAMNHAGKYIGGPGLLPSEKLGGSLVIAPNSSRLWYMGGTGAGGYEIASSTILEFDPVEPSWTLVELLPETLTAFGAVRGADGLYYIFGGGPSSTNHGAAKVTGHYYNPYTDKWGTVPDMDQAAKYLGAVATPDGRIWAIGGANDTTVRGDVQSLQVMSYSISAPSTVKTGEPFMAKVTIQAPFSSPVRFNIEAYIQGGDGTTYSYVNVTSPTNDPFAFELKLPQSASSGSYSIYVPLSRMIYSDTACYELEGKRLPLTVISQSAISDQMSALQTQISELEEQLSAIEAQTEDDLSDISDQATKVQSTVDNKADSTLMYLSMVMMVVIIALLALVLVMVRKKP